MNLSDAQGAQTAYSFLTMKFWTITAVAATPLLLLSDTSRSLVDFPCHKTNVVVEVPRLSLQDSYLRVSISNEEFV
jgi:hypothetical protein